MWTLHVCVCIYCVLFVYFCMCEWVWVCVDCDKCGCLCVCYAFTCTCIHYVHVDVLHSPSPTPHTLMHTHTHTLFAEGMIKENQCMVHPRTPRSQASWADHLITNVHHCVWRIMTINDLIRTQWVTFVHILWASQGDHMVANLLKCNINDSLTLCTSIWCL